MQYLQEDQYYINLYDLFTIKKCLRIINSEQKGLQKNVNEIYLYFIKGEEYKHKNERIKEWMQGDREKQDYYDNTAAPLNILCSSCGNKLYSDFKTLEDYLDKPMRMLFFFPCKTCKLKKAVYNNGQELIFEPARCPKCSSLIEEKHTIKTKGKGKIITSIKKCSACGFNETEIDDLDKSHAEFEERKNKDKELLVKYRSEFCLSDEEGQKYVNYTTQLKTLMESIKLNEQKQADPAYQKAKKLKKLNVVELEKLLAKILEKEKYIKLTLDKPEMGQYVIIPFTVQESDSKRKEYDTTANLKKLLKKTLEDTNWRLMSEGVSCRLGYVYGRLKGYEREDDLADLIRIKIPKNNPIIVDEQGPIY